MGSSFVAVEQRRRCHALVARPIASSHERTLTERRIVPPRIKSGLFDLRCLRSRHGAPVAPRPLTPPSDGVHARLARAFEAVSATNLVPINDRAEPSAS